MHNAINSALTITGATYSNCKSLRILAERLSQSEIVTPTEIKKAGEIAFFSRFLPHYLVSDDDCTLLLIQVGADFCSSYFPQIDHLILEQCNLKELIKTDEQKLLHEDMKHLCFDIAYNYYAQKPGVEFRCISDINRIFGYFIAAFPHQFLSESNIYHSFRTERRMMRILKYIDHHFTEKITLAEIAKMEDVSVPYLSQQFHSYVNMTFQEYIKQLRFEKACFLLSKTTLSLYDICIESGFSDQKYLTLAFKDAYGMTPSQYRKQYVSTIHLEQAHSKLKTENIQQIVPFESCIPILRKYHVYECEQNLSLRA